MAWIDIAYRLPTLGEEVECCIGEQVFRLRRLIDYNRPIDADTYWYWGKSYIDRSQNRPAGAVTKWRPLVSAGEIYEVVDSTDDKVYRSLGLFLTLQQAITGLEVYEHEPPVDVSGDCVCVEIRERSLGMDDRFRVIWARRWRRSADQIHWEISSAA